MSILQEYESIRKHIGESKYNAIEEYLNEVTPEENHEKYDNELRKLIETTDVIGKDFYILEQQLKKKYNIVLLSDIYYTEEGYAKFEKWYDKKYKGGRG